MRRVARAASWATAGGVFATAWHLRPRPEPEYVPKNVPPRGYEPPRHPHMQENNPSDPVLMQMARMVVIPLVVAGARIYGKVFNTFEMEGGDDLHKYIHNRLPGQALITVCNHTSVVDEPVLFACMLKAETVLKPHTMRWGACAQEICFANDFLATFFGTGKALPVRRGNGVMQHSWTVLATQVKKGHWVHVFPEAAVVQAGRLGSLKWGVGRLISFADPTAPPPLVVPFYHLGMEHTMPQDIQTNQLTTTIPSIFNKIRVKVGKPVDMSDLIAKYWVLKAKEEPSKSGMDISEADRWLWIEVTSRVRKALLELEKEMLMKYPDYKPLPGRDPPRLEMENKT